jgi:polysaccharide pyruvyl transferase WcaK-like protein
MKMNNDIILYGGTFLNKGGAAIAYGTMKVLRELGIKFDYIIDPEPFFPFEELNLSPIYRFSDSFSVNPIPSISPIFTAKPFFKCITRSFCHDIKQFDGMPIWHIGDSPFSDSRSALSIIGQIIALHSLKLSIGGNVIIGGISLDYPKTKIGKYLLPKYFRNDVDFTFTRGAYTTKVLSDFKVPSKRSTPICDFALHLDRIDSKRSYCIFNILKESRKPKIALVLRDFSQGSERVNYLVNIQKLLAKLYSKDYEVYFIPTTYAFLIPENDLIFLEKELSISQQNIINIRDLTPHEIISVFSNFEMVISARLHGAILGTLAHVPTIHLYEGGKSVEVLGEVFEDLVPLIKLKSFAEGNEIENMIQLIEKALVNKEQIGKNMEICIDTARNRSLITLKRYMETLIG